MTVSYTVARTRVEQRCCILARHSSIVYKRSMTATKEGGTTACAPCVTGSRTVVTSTDINANVGV